MNSGNYNEIFHNRFPYIAQALDDFNSNLDENDELLNLSYSLWSKSWGINLLIKSKTNDPFYIFELSRLIDIVYWFEEDLKKAFELTKLAVSKNHPEAFTSLGDMYREGEGAEINNKKAIESYEKGIELGVNASMNELAKYYIDGTYLKQDIKKGINLLEKSIKPSRIYNK